MTAETLKYAGVMLAAGIGIPILAALNAQLGARLGSPVAAGTVLFVVAFAGAAAVLMLTGGPGPLRVLPGQPAHLFAAGLFVCFYVLSVTWVAPRFGVGNAVFFVLLGQLVSAAIIDHFGLFGAMVKPFGPTRGAGIGLMALGVLLTQRA